MDFVAEDKRASRAHYINHELVGPVIHRWMLGLHQYISFFDDGDTTFLYCARAGVRIKQLYDLYLSKFDERPETNGPLDMFWISRLAVAKGTYGRIPSSATGIIAREYWHVSLADLTRGLLRHHPDVLSGLDLSDPVLEQHGAQFETFITTDHPVSKTLTDYFHRSGLAFDEYIALLTQERSRVVLIDSGWQGSAQSLLTHAYPDKRWKGIYFGRITTHAHDPSIGPDTIGVMFESEKFDPERPETSIVAHRHLIETLLEPNGQSIEVVPHGEFEKIARPMVQSNLDEIPSEEFDAVFLAAQDYLGKNVSLPPSEVEARYQKAIRELATVLVNPTRLDAEALFCKKRSADFGKDLLVPVLLPTDHASFKSSDDRIKHALWPQGQVALEHDGEIARDIQNRITGLSDSVSYFDPNGAGDNSTAGGLAEAGPQAFVSPKPTVAIITRTKNRPVLLKRAAESVANQTYTHYQWVIVNDGGDEDVVRKVIEECAVDRRKIKLVSNARSLGMEAASNRGIQASQSDYVLIHDDDDTLDPAFLEKSVGYLEASSGRRYGGVITQTTYVSEEICGDDVIIHETFPYQQWVRNVQIGEMMTNNIFAPICFLYRRSIYDGVGGYNEELPVLGDWFFNLEFLLKADIGVLLEPLAFYHHRDRGDSSRSGIYSNSVIGGQSKHEEYASIMRNTFFRKYGDSHSGAVAAILGYMIGEMRHLNSAGTTASADNETALVTSVADTADRMWIIANINWQVQKQMMNGQVSSELDLLSPDADWVTVIAKLKDSKLTLLIPPDFDEVAYLNENPDVSNAVASNTFANGYTHYLLYGRDEGRRRPILSVGSRF